MQVFNVDVSKLNIKQELKDEFNFYQNKLNQEFLSVKLHFDNQLKLNENKKFLFKGNFRQAKSLKIISSNFFWIKFSLTYCDSTILLFPHENKIDTKLKNISDLSFLADLIEGFNFEEMATYTNYLKELSRKIQKNIKPKIQNNSDTEKLNQVGNFFKSFYVNENDDILKNKQYKKISISKSEKDLMIGFNNTNKSSFLPIFFDDDFLQYKEIEHNELSKQLLSFNPHIPDFLFDSVFYYFEKVEGFYQRDFIINKKILNEIYPLYEAFILKEKLKDF